MNPKVESNRLAYMTLVATAVLWSATGIAVKIALIDLPPLTLAFIRFLISSLVLVSFQILKKSLVLPPRRDWLLLFALGMMGTFGANFFFYKGLEYTTAINTALIGAGSPIVITILTVIILGERISQSQMLGIFLSFLGVVVVITKGLLSVLVNLDFNFGDILMLGYPLTWGFYNVLTKKLIDRYSPILLLTYSTVIGTTLFVPMVIYEIATTEHGISFSASGAGSIFYLALLASIVGNVWWNQAIKKVGASRTGIFMNVVPICTMILSSLLLSEKIGIPQIIGAGMVLIGVYLNSLKGTAIQQTQIPIEKSKSLEN